MLENSVLGADIIGDTERMLGRSGQSLTVLQITPLPLQSDSRTFKQAETFARAGYRSVVLEGVKSASLPSISFELISPESSNPAQTPKQNAGQAAAYSTGSMWASRLKKFGFKFVVDAVVVAISIRSYLGQQSIVKWANIPSADIVVLHSFYYFPMAMRLTKGSSVKIIYDAHDAYHTLYSTDDDTQKRSSWLGRFFNTIEKRCIQRADIFLSVGDGVAGIIERRFGRRPAVLRNMHDSRLNRSVDSTIRKSSGVRPEDFLLVSVGNFKLGMAIPQLLMAMKESDKRVHLAFLGLGYDEIRPLIAKSGLSDRVHLLAPVAPDQVTSFIQSADVAVLTYFALTPNYEYCLPNGFFHSIAARLPIICPNLPEMQCIVEREQNGIVVDATKWEQVRDAIGCLSSDGSLLDRVRAAAVRISSEYTWENEEGVLLSIVEDLLGDPAGQKCDRNRSELS